MSPEDLGTQVKLGGPGGESSPWPPHTNMMIFDPMMNETFDIFIWGSNQVARGLERKCGKKR